MTTDPRARCPHCQLWTVAVVQQDPRVEQCTACGRQPTDDAARRFLRPDHQVIADLEADVRRLTTERDEARELASFAALAQVAVERELADARAELATMRAEDHRKDDDPDREPQDEPTHP